MPWLGREALLAKLTPMVSRDEFYAFINFEVYRPRHLVHTQGISPPVLW